MREVRSRKLRFIAIEKVETHPFACGVLIPAGNATAEDVQAIHPRTRKVARQNSRSVTAATTVIVNHSRLFVLPPVV